MKNKNDTHDKKDKQEVHDKIQEDDEVNEQQEEKNDTDEVKQRITELEDQLKRAVADYRNLEKRVDEEKREIIKYANRDLLESLMPSFDMLFLAEKYVQDDGLKLTIKALSDSLQQAGVQRVTTVGQDFDPNTMEVVESVDGDPSTSSGQEQYIVVDELRPGFLLHGKLLRAALVKVGSGRSSN